MPMPNQQRVTQRGVPQGQAPQPVQARVAAQGTEHLPNYIPQQRDPALQGLLEGLSSISPTIQKQLQAAGQEEANTAVLDRMAGREPQKDSWNYTEHYLHTDGVVKGQEDGASLLTSYQTEFDKDGGNLEEFLKDKYEGTIKGLQPGPFLSGHDKSVAPIFAQIRQDHLTYQKNAVTTRVESNAMVLLKNGFDSYAGNGEAVAPEYIQGIKTYMGENLGVSSQRFNELLFATAQNRAMAGDFTAFDILKKPQPDGTPGLYSDPKWQHKIDTAANEAYSASETRGRLVRQERQETALYSVFSKLYDGKPQEARAEFDEAKKAGLFTRASDLVKYEELFGKVQNKEARIDQQTTELELQAKIYTGKATIQDVLRADLTAGQKRSLIGEAYKVKQDARIVAATADKQEKAIFKSSEYRSGTEYINGALASSSSSLDPFGTGGQYDRQQRATAQLEFTQAAQRAQTPQELNTVREEIVQRHLKLRKEMEKSKDIQGAGLVRYNTPAEAADAARKGLLTKEELALHLNFYKARNAR